jgi:hypothetical protein
MRPRCISAGTELPVACVKLGSPLQSNYHGNYLVSLSCALVRGRGIEFFAIPTVVLLKVLETFFVVVLLCHSSDTLVALSFRCFAIWDLALPLLFSFVRTTTQHISTVFASTCYKQQTGVSSGPINAS